MTVRAAKFTPFGRPPAARGDRARSALSRSFIRLDPNFVYQSASEVSISDGQLFLLCFIHAIVPRHSRIARYMFGVTGGVAALLRVLLSRHDALCCIQQNVCVCGTQRHSNPFVPRTRREYFSILAASRSIEEGTRGIVMTDEEGRDKHPRPP